MRMNEALQAMADLLADPSHWTKGVLARDSRGYACSPLDPDACQWCLLGAARKVAGMDQPLYGQIVAFLHNRLSQMPTTYNDSSTTQHPDVLAVLQPPQR